MSSVDAGVLPPCGLLARKGLRTVSNATCGAHWETKNPIPSRRRLDYASVAAVVIAIWLIIALSPLFVIVLAVWCCYCRNRKNNSIVVTTQQYIKKSRSSQARPVVEAAPVAKMV